MQMNMVRKGWLVLAVLAATICAVVRPSFAGESQTDEWQFSTSLYAWAVGLNGNVTIKNRSVDVDVSFLDVVKESDSIFAFMGTFDATKGKWGLFFNPAYMNISAEKGATLGPVNASIDATTEIAIIGFGGTYRVAEWAAGPKDSGSNNPPKKKSNRMARCHGWWPFDLLEGQGRS